MNTKQDKAKKKVEQPVSSISKVARMGFAGVALGFTVISAWNGFHFYRVLFGVSMAVLISVTFEVARFSCLFKYIRKGKRPGILAITLYIATAAFCAFSSINSFTAEFIRQNRLNSRVYQLQIDNIRQVYAKRSQTRLETFEQDIQFIKNQVAKYPGRKYWERRLEQILSDRDAFITKREEFLNYNPPDPEEWIRVQSAKLEIKTAKGSPENEAILSVKQALQELWGLDELTAQKIVGIILTLVVELAIILLAALSTMEEQRGSMKVKKEAALHENAAEKNEIEFDERHVEIFREYIKDKGKLPPKRTLTKKLRPIRDFLEGFDQDRVQALFQQ